jgi:hypothetical protein
MKTEEKKHERCCPKCGSDDYYFDWLLKVYIKTMIVITLLAIFIFAPIMVTYNHRLKDEVGKTVVLNGDTLIIVNYSGDEVTLSNGVKVKYKILKK